VAFSVLGVIVGFFVIVGFGNGSRLGSEPMDEMHGINKPMDDTHGINKPARINAHGRIEHQMNRKVKKAEAKSEAQGRSERPLKRARSSSSDELVLTKRDESARTKGMGSDVAKATAAAAATSTTASDESSNKSSSTHLTDEEVKHFREKGYVVVQNVVSEKQLQSMRAEIELLIKKYARENRSVEDEGCALDLFADVGIPEESQVRTSTDAYMALRRTILARARAMEQENNNDAIEQKKRALQEEDQIISGLRTAKDNSKSRQKEEAAVEVFLKRFPLLCKQLLGSRRIFLFNEQYIVKPRESDVSFAWHTDAEEQLGMWYKPDAVQYISAWCALDDMSEENGTLLLRVQNAAAAPTAVKKESTSDAEHVTILCSAGDCVLFTSSMWHCSGPNRTKKIRRVAYAQYTPTVITGGGGSGGNDSDENDDGDKLKAHDKIKKPQTPLYFAIPPML